MSAAIQVQPGKIRLDGWIQEYPSCDGYHSQGLGYSSDMVDLALRGDDPEAFIYFMNLAGCGRNAETLTFTTMERYCKNRNALKCLKALARLPE